MQIQLAKDPVCEMQVQETKTRWKSVYEGGTYYFDRGYKSRFDENPGEFVG
jgi:YHS domain-containing protein